MVCRIYTHLHLVAGYGTKQRARPEIRKAAREQARLRAETEVGRGREPEERDSKADHFNAEAFKTIWTAKAQWLPSYVLTENKMRCFRLSV
jgi:hypothetical protein